MQDLMKNPSTDLHNTSFTFIKYIYKSKTRCRFKVYRLRNSNRFAKHLNNEFRNLQGIYNIRPSSITGNVLITFDSHRTNNNEIFSKLETTVCDYIKTSNIACKKRVTVPTLTKNSQNVNLHSIKNEEPLRKNRQNHKTYSNHRAESKSQNFNKILPVVLKTVGTLLIQHFTKKFTQASLSRLGV